MVDFLMISTRSTKRGAIEIFPKFKIKKSSDLMIRGGDFYAIWIEELGLWSTDEQDAIQVIDKELDKFAEENRSRFDGNVSIQYMWDASTGVIDSWHKYCQKQMRDSFHMLDEKLIFSNMETSKKDYASKKLTYPLEKGDIVAYDKLMSTLYSPDERQKIEWAIGSIVSGDSKKLQKFLVLYGAAGTGKSTVLNIIQQLFDGYYSVFDAKALGSSSNAFALEAFKSNPLIAIQHDGDLSHIEDNTRLNSLVSHEMMTVNEKFRPSYANRFKCFLFMGTNKPVKITDAKSGLIRRLIDVSPSGKKLSQKEYKTTVKQVEFELGAIAYHCKEVFLEDPGFYDDYIPTAMLGASNDFYNYIVDSYYVFKKEDGTTLKAAWEMYKTYCEEARVPYPYSQRVFKEELRNYFWDFKERYRTEDDVRVRNYYIGFRNDKFEDSVSINNEDDKKESTIDFSETVSSLDKECSECPAQYASSNETPTKKWDNVTTKLKDIDTSKLHYLKVPENHIVIDFDIPDKKGEKSYEKNLLAASSWPPTYAELSKSGSGIHLHYYYAGDVSTLSRLYDEHIEIKVSSGNGSLRRKLTKCNNLGIATIGSGLPTRGKKNMVNVDTIRSEKSLRSMVKRNLEKEIHPATKPSIDFIQKILDDAYSSGMNYDLTDMRNAVLAFGAGSSNQAEYCVKAVNKMKFKSDDASETIKNENKPIVFFDIEIYPDGIDEDGEDNPGLFLVNWKFEGDKKKVVRMVNPTPNEIEGLLKYRLIGFNCRRYDNHMLYARLMGYTNHQLYNLSQKIINKSANCFFNEAYNISYTDVFDFSSEKKSLKKFEIELGIHHQEMGIPWDKPVPKRLWETVMEYCDNDVIATEAVFHARKSDFLARLVLADVAEMSPNDATNSLTTRIIFGRNRTPQGQFEWRDMAMDGDVKIDAPDDPESDDFTMFDKKGKPIFPGYTYEFGKSTYRGEEISEGGYVYAEPGMYGNVALLDIASMHPHSTIAENLFGDDYTSRFKEIVDARIAIKHKDFEHARKMLGGKLTKYLTDESSAGDLAQALKIAINSVYGLTAAKFDNAFRDNRNIDNIVAKRGALFMVNLKHEVMKRGFRVAHIKTDSIKIPDATPEIIKFVTDYGKQYGYDFEHEATYDRMCLVNDAVYIAKYDNGKWTATGTQFKIPYVFKTLFSKEPIEFEDLCETKSVTGSLYLDMNEDLPDVSEYEKELKKLEKKAVTVESDSGKVYGAEDGKRLGELTEKISSGHKYEFVGKVGLFCPIKQGCGGGILFRSANGKMYAAGGTKGYRWLESEHVQKEHKEKDIDMSYYEELASEAIKGLVVYGDYEWFVSDDPYVSPEFKEGKPIYKDWAPYN